MGWSDLALGYFAFWGFLSHAVVAVVLLAAFGRWIAGLWARLLVEPDEHEAIDRRVG